MIEDRSHKQNYHHPASNMQSRDLIPGSPGSRHLTRRATTVASSNHSNSSSPRVARDRAGSRNHSNIRPPPLNHVPSTGGDDGEDLYMDMTVKGSTPPRRSNTVSSSPRSNSTFVTQQQRKEIMRIDTRAAQGKWDHMDSMLSPLSPPFGSDGDDGDYADMTGVNSASNSPHLTHRSSPVNSMRSRTAGGSQSMVVRHPTNSPRTPTGVQRHESLSKPIPTLNNKTGVTSGRGKNIIKEGSFHKDDDGDYDDYEDDYMPMTPKKPTPAEFSPRPALPPDLTVRPATPTKLFQSMSLTNVAQTAKIPPRSFGFSDSSEDEEEQNKNTAAQAKINYRSKSLNAFNENARPTDLRQTKALVDKKPGSTEAGRAARKYLQHGDTKLSPVKRNSSFGLARSSSRAGKQGGVVSRISKVRQTTSAKNAPYYDDDSDSDDNIQPAPSPNKILQRTTSCLSKPSAAEFERRRSQTLDQLGTKSFDTQGSDDGEMLPDGTKGSKQQLDGSLLMKLLASDVRSKSLDKKYLEWLAKTSPYASRHSSASGRQQGRSTKTSSVKSPVTSDDEIDAQVNDDEAFENFSKVIQGGYNHQAVATKVKSPDKKTSGVSLADFAEMRSHKSPETPDSRPRENVKEEIEAMKKAMTLKPVVAADSVEFSDLAKAFYEDYNNDKKKKGKKGEKKNEKKNKDVKKVKESRSMRKSFRFGSRKKLTASTPELSEKQTKSIGSPAQEEASGLPSIKPPLGISPAKKTHTRERSSSSSNSLKRSEKKNDAKDNWSKARTLERGMFLSNHSAHDVTDVNASWESNLKVMEKSSLSKSGTLSRLFTKKVKERKGLDVVDSASKIFSPDGSDSDHNDSKGGTLERPVSNEADLTPSQRYFKLCQISKGMVIKQDAADSSEGIEIGFINGNKSTSRRPTHVNKYATITGLYLSQQQGQDSSPKKLSRNLSAEGSGKVSDASGTEEGGNRIKRTRPSLRGLSNSLSRNTKASALKNFAIGEEEGANDYSLKQELGVQQAPLRTRPRQKVQPLYSEPSPRLLATARLLYRHIVQSKPGLLRQHKAAEEGIADSLCTDADVYEHCAFGHELVTWLQTRTQPKQLMVEDPDIAITSSRSRWKVSGMWQVLQEEGLISHVRREQYFEDRTYLYQFHKDVTSYVDGRDDLINDDVSSTRSSVDSGFGHSNGEMGDDFSGGVSRSSSIASAAPMISSEMSQMMMSDSELSDDAITYLQQNAPDALFRLTLRKLPEDRTEDELMMIYEEILHIKALAHLSDSIKRELAAVLQFEHHQESGMTLFNQGDEGRSWFIILRGSVDVAIHGKGVVCTLHEGDDFGNLAIINDAPRAASIVLSEKNCQFLRVDKFDFVRILKDVEANTVRLKEHDKDVLILQKIHARSSASQPRGSIGNGSVPQFPVAATPTRQCHKYSISAGTAEKILEHLLEYLQPWNIGRREETMEDFIILYSVFMTTDHLCNLLLKHYRSENADSVECSRSLKRKVVYFTVRWSHISSYLFCSDPAIESFLKDLKEDVHLDILGNPSYSLLKDDLNSVYTSNETDICNNGNVRQSLITVGESVQRFQPTGAQDDKVRPVRATDQVLLKVYNMKKTYTTVMISISASVRDIVSAVAEKQSRSTEGLFLLEAQEDGDVLEVPRKSTSVATSLKVNSRLYICTEEERAMLNGVKWFSPPTASSHLEVVSSLEIAYHVTQYDWKLLNNVHVVEFVYKVFGAHKFNGVTSNLDIFSRRFNQLAYWAPTEICSCQNLNKRVQLLRKFIKIAQHLKMYQNMNGFMSMMIGIGNQAVSRLYNTWEKLPAKYRKLVQEYESILDPSRNHRSYRLYVSTLQSPVILYLPLLLKDMTFQHEGNDSIKNGLVNFEKMHMISNSIRTVVQGCASRVEQDHMLETTKTAEESRNYVRQLQVITDQRVLNEMSNKLEPRR